MVSAMSSEPNDLDEAQEDLGEMFELPEEISDVEDTEDGGAIVRFGEDEEEPEGEREFYMNLAEKLPEGVMDEVAQDFLGLIAKDKEARKKRDEQYEEGIRRTGLGDDAPGGAQFQGASRVVHPMLTEVCVDFSARAIKELFPPEGPAKDHIVGDETADKVAKAQRKTRYLNWQMTQQMPEFRAELEQLLTQVPLGGAQYLKLSYDPNKKRPVPLFIGIDDVYLPYAATNFYSAERKTHVQYVTEIEYLQRVKSEMYRDVDLAPTTMEPDVSKAEKANNKIEGRDGSAYDVDGLRTIFEIYAIADIEEEYGLAPYIFSIDKVTGKVLAVYRNWEEGDETLQEMQWIVEFPFVPWRGAYPIGIPQMIGGISAAATGALRALLDSAHIANFPGMLKLKGGREGGQSERIDPTEVKEIEGGAFSDDIRKIAMPLPFNQPSPVLYQLLGFLVDAGKGVVRTTLEDIADNQGNMPVGTQLARIEQGMVVFNAIHARLHDAMGRTLKVLHRINAMYLENDEVKDETGQLLVRRSDFEGPMDVVPVSDPNIFSEAQRFAQVQALSQRAMALPQVYNIRKVEERILQQLRVPNAKELLVAAPEPKEMNAINENVAATLGRPVSAFPEQDHLAHLQVHLDYLTSPILGSSMLMAPTFVPGILNHIKEHIALWYATHVFEVASKAAGQDISEFQKIRDVEVKKSFDQLLAAASQKVVPNASQAFGAIPQIVQQAMGMLQQLSGMNAPQDPRMAAQMAETQRKAQADQASLQVKQAELQLEQAKAQQAAAETAQRQSDNLKREMIKQDRLDNRQAAELEVKMTTNREDNDTAKQIAAMEAITGEKVGVSTGTGINP
jgi:chaperonin GroES